MLLQVFSDISYTVASCTENEASRYGESLSFCVPTSSVIDRKEILCWDYEFAFFQQTFLFQILHTL